MNDAEKRQEAEKILAKKGMMPDQKLFAIFELYKDELQSRFPQLSYAFLGWKDSHLKELYSKEIEDLLVSFNSENDIER